jgi:predicted transcriptional regulator
MARPKKGQETHSTQTIAVRVTPDLKSKLEAVARDLDAPYSVVVIEAIEQYLGNRKGNLIEGATVCR